MSRSERRQFWFSHLDAWRISGLSQAAYCRLHTLNAKSFSNWLHRDPPATAPAASPVSPTPPVPVSAISSAPLTLITVRTPTAALTPAPSSPALILHGASGWALELPSTAPPQWLAEVLRGLS